MRIDHSQATKYAVTIGQGMAVLMGLWGLFGSGGFFLIFIAIFIFGAAGQECRMARIRSALGDMTVREAYSGQVLSLTPKSTLRDAIHLSVNSFQSDFPIREGDLLLGLLTHRQLAAALRKAGPDALVTAFMRTDLEPVSPDEKLYVAQQLLGEAGSDALPVIEGDQFLGLVTAQDINKVYQLVSRWPGSTRSKVGIAEV